MALLDEIRKACAGVAADARSVRIREAAIDPYARALEPPAALRADPAIVPLSASREQLAGFVLTLDAINFGSGWFPTLRKRPGRSGYFTIALGLRERFDADPDSFAAARLGEVDAAWLAEALGQAPDHELIGLYTAALREPRRARLRAPRRLVRAARRSGRGLRRTTRRDALRLAGLS